MLKKLSVTLCAACALLLVGCGESTTNTNNSNAGNANRTSTTTTTTTTNSTTPNSNAAASTTTTTTAGGEKIGIAECDDFIEKYEACISGKVPEVARAQYRNTIEQWRNSWRGIAANPQTRGTLAQVCKTSIEQARTSMKSFGCEF